MALNENTKNLIRSVTDNDLEKAKEIIKIIVSNETSSKNKYFCNSIKAKLETQHKFIELPYNLQNILKMEDVSNFNENRYFLSEREREVFNQICMAKNTNEQLSEMGIRYLNSTLLYGESGTGKTTFGKYIAYKLKMPFAYLNFSYCIDSHLGETSKNINKVFDYVSNQKCVLLLDEIDAIGIKRGKEDLGEMARIVIGLMQAFDLLENDLIVIGATNRKDMIDEALIRRFSIHHEVKALNQYEVSFLIQKILQDLKIEYDIEDIQKYSKEHNKQSEIVNDITKAIVKMLNEKEKFTLSYKRKKAVNEKK